MEVKRMMFLSATILIVCGVQTTAAHVDDQQVLQFFERVQTLEKQGKEQNDIIIQLQEQLVEQTDINKKLQGHLNQQIRQLTEQQRQLDKQNMKLLHQEELITHIYTSVKTPPSKTYASEENSADFNLLHVLSNPQENNHEIKTKDKNKEQEFAVKNIREEGAPREDRFIADVEGPIAFHAVIARGQVAHIGLNQNIVFDVIVTNIGGAYHNQHGVFIAPRAGIYIFSTSILTYVNDHAEFQADVKKNGNVLARVFGHGDSGREDQGSVTVVTQMNTGDEVWVSLTLPADGSIYGDRFTSFMGCLIMAL